MKRITVKMELLAEYRGWAIERNPSGLIVAADGWNFPLIAPTIEAAKLAIDARIALAS
jgi:hypothetical protein